MTFTNVYKLFRRAQTRLSCKPDMSIYVLIILWENPSRGVSQHRCMYSVAPMGLAATFLSTYFEYFFTAILTEARREEELESVPSF